MLYQPSPSSLYQASSADTDAELSMRADTQGIEKRIWAASWGSHELLDHPRHLAALIHRVKNVQFDYRSVTGGTIDRCLATPSDPPFLIEGYYRSKIEASS